MCTVQIFPCDPSQRKTSGKIETRSKYIYTYSTGLSMGIHRTLAAADEDDDDKEVKGNTKEQHHRAALAGTIEKIAPRVG